MRPTLQFLGAAGTVTGSMHLVSTGERRILLDCGLFQGLKALRLRNWDRRVPDPRGIDAVVLSHAHVDHSGYLPLLARQGFRGPIYCTAGTADLLDVVLPDAAHLQEEAAERANQKGYSRHKPALPLYTLEDAHAALRLVERCDYGRAVPVTDGATARLRRAGHILGSATVELQLNGTGLVYSGDLGRYDRPILRDPEAVPAADVLLLESTYGDRPHPTGVEADLIRIVRDAAVHGGAILVPAFAVDRTQELLWMLRRLEEAGKVPALPVYIDSPMAIEVTDIYRRHPPRTTVLLVGFQAAGTRGRALADGAAGLKMFGQMVPVRARVERIDALSAHADAGETLRWLGGFERPPQSTYLVHGEPQAASALAGAIRARYGWRVEIAREGETVVLA